jgi:hypothetical protein
LPRRLCHFFLDKKVTKKSSQQKGFFAAQAFALQIRQNRGCNLFALASPAHARASSKICYALQPHMATIVLPDFGRSCSADGGGTMNKPGKAI